MLNLYFFMLDSFSEIKNKSRSEKSKIISKKAYELLNEKLYEILDFYPEIKKTDRGKPYISDSSIQVSISHSDNAIFIGISDNPIGIDTEMPRSFSEYAVKRLFSDAEQNYISSGDQDINSTELWTKREAVCKLTGEGFSDWFFNCSLVDNNGIPFDEIEKDGKKIYIKTIIIENHICTVASTFFAEEAKIIECTL